MKSETYDLIVIGSGPGGEAAAMMSVKKGLKVMMVDANPRVGGGSVHWGTIPSKTIRESILILKELNQQELNQHLYSEQAPYQRKIKFEGLIQRANAVVQAQEKTRQSFYERNLVRMVHGWAKFISPQVIEVNSDNLTECYQAKHFVIATGSSPHHPPDIDFSQEKILDSNKVLQLKETPRSLTIYGAGIIGAEYACMFRHLGIKVDLINSRERVLDFLDIEIIDAFNHYMREEGIVIRNNETFEKVEIKDDQVHLSLKSGKVIKHHYLLWTQGRTGNSRKMGLEDIEIKIDSRGYIVVDQNYVTTHEHIYAVGDVIGWPSLAATAHDQGKVAASHLLGLKGKRNSLKLFPVGIYTSPEISCIGKTEQELTHEKVAYEVGKVNYSNLARAQIVGDERGMLKILFHRETLEILGIHCFGKNAAEIIHIGQAVMNMPEGYNSIEYFLLNTLNYPTMSEAYRIAAQNGINRL